MLEVIPVLLFLTAASIYVGTQYHRSTDPDAVSTDPNNVRFYLFPNAANVTDCDELVYLDLDSIENSRYSPDKYLIILSHGFTQTYTSDFPTIVVKNYLEAGYGQNANIIGVDWGRLSGYPNGFHVDLIADLALLPLYNDAVSNVPVVGRRIQEFIGFLEGNDKVLEPNRTHLIGFSLGAHVSGMAGMYYNGSSAGSLGRITGVDPAGPRFYFKSSTEKLDISDADFVDIVHTNQGLFGYAGEIGHVDFYVNGGGPLPQPGCVIDSVISPGCSHLKAPHYYAASIGNKGIRGVTPINSSLDTRSNSHFVLPFGELCPTSARGKYNVRIILPSGM